MTLLSYSTLRRLARTMAHDSRPAVTCRVCGKTFKAITHTHLKEHGITLERYRATYEQAVDGVVVPVEVVGPLPDPSTPQVPAPTAIEPGVPTRMLVTRGELFDNLADWIAQDSQLSPFSQRVVESLMADEGKRFALVLRGIAAAKLEDVSAMLRVKDDVNKHLLKVDRLSSMSTSDLIKIRQLLDADMSQFIELLKFITSGEQPPVNFNFNVAVDQRQVSIGGQSVPLPDSGPERERLVRLMQQLRELAAPTMDPSSPAIPVMVK